MMLATVTTTGSAAFFPLSAVASEFVREQLENKTPARASKSPAVRLQDRPKLVIRVPFVF